MFRINGLGRYFVTSTFNRDYPMIMATTMVWTAIICLTYLVTDLLYAALDPRIKYAD